jgi:hypothetical protein
MPVNWALLPLPSLMVRLRSPVPVVVVVAPVVGIRLSWYWIGMACADAHHNVATQHPQRRRPSRMGSGRPRPCWTNGYGLSHQIGRVARQIQFVGTGESRASSQEVCRAADYPYGISLRSRQRWRASESHFGASSVPW